MRDAPPFITFEAAAEDLGELAAAVIELATVRKPVPSHQKTRYCLDDPAGLKI